MGYQETKAFINANIKPNGENEITGSILNTALNDVLDSGHEEVGQLGQYIDENAYKVGKNKFNKNSPGCVIGSGYYGDGWFDGNFNTSDYIPVSPGKNYVFSDNGVSCSIRWITFFDSDKNYISGSVLNSQTSITIPAGAAYVRLAPSNSIWNTLQMEEGIIITPFEEYRVEYIGGYLSEGSTPIDRLQLMPGVNLLNPTAKGVMLDTMVYGETVSSIVGLNTTDYIQVVEGEDYSFFSSLGYSMRFITFYDADKNAISYLGSQIKVTIPAGTKYVRITISNKTWNKCSFACGGVNSNYIPFKTIIPDEYIKGGLFSGAKYNGTIINHDTLYFLNQHISKNSCLTLMAVGTISDISFGVGKNADGGTFVNLTATQIVVYHIDGATQLVATYNHGLTLTDRTYLHINEKDDRNAEITLCSGGEQYVVESVEWGGRGQVFLSSDNGASMDFEVSVMLSDLCKQIWIFGDSYYSHDVDNRHLYYIYSLGYKNFLLNNKGGIASGASFADFKNILSLGYTPKYALWGLGMNDGSDTDEDTPDSTWLSYIQNFISICLERKIIPILATIPSAYDSNTDTLYYHDGKSKWVRNSGYRYIDYAKAVDSNAQGIWGNGYKGADVHPTAKGARMLANQLLLDFAEICVGTL